MKKLNQTYIDNLVNRVITETLEEKADDIVKQINELGEDSKIEKMMNSYINSGDDDFDSFDYMDENGWTELDEGEMCEQCGKPYAMEGEMYEEGETCECGSGNMYEYEEMEELENAPTEFDYVAEDDDIELEDEISIMGADSDGDPLDRVNRFCNRESDEYNEQSCKYHKKLESELTEKLHGGQRKLDKNKNGRIDAEDFKMLRKREEKEGNAFTGALARAKDRGDDEFEVDGKKYDVRESKKSNSRLKLTETQMIDLIEKIIREENEVKNNIKMGNPKGLEKYKQVHSKDGKENDDYIKMVAKKMKEYLKDGSMGEYDTNPKIFPKGNGELAKMKKKAYVPSGAVEDYIDNFTAAGLENLDYDEIHPNEEWVTANIEGSSKTGNNPEWANTGESDVNKKRNKIRKDNMLAKIKRKAYNKAPQPVVNDSAGEDEGDKIMAKLESIEPKSKNKLNEEFGRMKSLMGYNQKTQ